MNEREESYIYWLGSTPLLSVKKKWELLRQFQSAARLYQMDFRELQKYTAFTEKEQEAFEYHRKTWDVSGSYGLLQRKRITYVPIISPYYPEKLKHISPLPFALFVKGRLPDPGVAAVAIVGARMCSRYGEMTAYEYGRELARQGGQVISGLARGIDSFAQMGAVEGNGASFAVMGCGVDICYPREHIELFYKLQEQGGIISEYPPGTPPKPFRFPARNRIISGLAGTILVVEAKEKSGSLITADMALEQGKDVYAVPGRINDALSKGCNRLIKQGAGIAAATEEFLEDLQLLPVKQAGRLSHLNLNEKENIVYQCLDYYPQNIHQLSRKLNMAIQELIHILLSLELKGIIEEIAKSNYIKK